MVVAAFFALQPIPTLNRVEFHAKLVSGNRITSTGGGWKNIPPTLIVLPGLKAPLEWDVQSCQSGIDVILK